MMLILTFSLRVFSEGVDLDHRGVLGHEERVQVDQNLGNLLLSGNNSENVIIEIS